MVNDFVLQLLGLDFDQSHYLQLGKQDCVGASDGIHILAFLPLNSQPSYRNRKGTLSQNVLVTCGFDLKFLYVLPGWEGFATDTRILHNALSRLDPLVVPPCNYVDIY